VLSLMNMNWILSLDVARIDGSARARDINADRGRASREEDQKS
jgi:hypothetical protein